MGNLKAITFDLWDTLVIDDSDEAKRKERGLRSKFDERRHLLWEALNNADPIDPRRPGLPTTLAMLRSTRYGRNTTSLGP